MPFPPRPRQYAGPFACIVGAARNSGYVGNMLHVEPARQAIRPSAFFVVKEARRSARIAQFASIAQSALAFRMECDMPCQSAGTLRAGIWRRTRPTGVETSCQHGA